LSKFILALLIGFLIILAGSVIVPSFVLSLLFGPYPTDGNVSSTRYMIDFSISFLFTILGGYIAAKVATVKPLLVATLAGVMYFLQSAYWYSGYGLSGFEWIMPIMMLVKVPFGALLGGFIFLKYNKALMENNDSSR